MRIIGYLEHLDLGIDPESGKPNVLVQNAQEYNVLTAEEKSRAWATIKVASEISERVAVTMYQQTYSGKIPSKTIKKNAWDRRGLTLIKVPQNIKTKADRRNDDINRVVRVLRRTLKATSWLPGGQQLLISAVVDMRLRNIERELFGATKEAEKKNQLTQEGKGITAMRATVKDKRKGPDHETNRNLALKGESPFTPKQLEGKLSLEGAELQGKMKAAAKEFVKIYQEFQDSMFDLIPPPGTSFAEAYEQHQTNMWGDCLYCTPVSSIMFRLGTQWIKITEETVAEGCKEIAPEDEDVPQVYSSAALRILKEAKRWAKKAGRVGWVLPRLEKEVA
jgi:hypothetical protein